jgi:hypothetical protein
VLGGHQNSRRKWQVRALCAWPLPCLAAALPGWCRSCIVHACAISTPPLCRSAARTHAPHAHRTHCLNAPGCRAKGRGREAPDVQLPTGGAAGGPREAAQQPPWSQRHTP